MKNFFRHFGARASKKELVRYAESANWEGGKFQNLTPTRTLTNPWNIGGILVEQFTNRKQREPKASLPILALDKTSFLDSSEETKMVWYGHSVVLLNIMGKKVLIDPMLGPNAAPISPQAVKRFSEGSLGVIDTLPELDLVLISHDHYDHLDYESVLRLIPKTNLFLVALGVKRHLVKWGVSEEKIQEFDWWDSKIIEDINITFTPSRHMSGRGLTDRNKSLWGGWCIKSSKENIWFSGDGGYGDHVKSISAKLGPFDFAFMECGQYNENWKFIHSLPSESVKTAIEVKAKKAMPVHWAGFSLAMHSWKEPAEAFAKFAKKEGQEVSFPRIGQVFTIKNDLSENHWWNDHE